jgi:ribosomal protein S20
MQSNENIRTIQIEIRRISKTVRRSQTRAFCFLCDAQVELISMAQAAERCRTTQYEIYQLVEQGEVHRIHNSKGSIMVCRNSLEKAKNDFHDAQTIILKPLELCQ